MRYRWRSLRRAAANAARAREWPRARTAYGEYLSRVPDDARARIQHGHACKESGDLDGAEQAYLGALRIRSDDADLHLQLGHLFKLRQQAGQARAHYQLAAIFDPSLTNARLEMGNIAADDCIVTMNASRSPDPRGGEAARQANLAIRRRVAASARLNDIRFGSLQKGLDDVRRVVLAHALERCGDSLTKA